MRVLVACEESQVVMKAFRVRGHDAYSCDIIPPSGGEQLWHIQADALETATVGGWDLMIAHPPCTYLTVSANKWFKDQPPRKSGALVGEARRLAREEAVKFFMALISLPIPRIAVENPVGIMSSKFRRPDQVIQPWMFGHGETKATCLWLKGLPLLKPTNIVMGREQRLHQLAPTKDRSALRSKTFQGIADAMGSQWGF